jgi:hypothetical protein
MPAIGIINLLTRLGPYAQSVGRATGILGAPGKRSAFSKYFDPRKVKAGEKVASPGMRKPVRLQEGDIKGSVPRYLLSDKPGARIARFGGTLAAADYGLGKVMGLFDDEDSDLQSDDAKAMRTSVFPAQPSAPSYDIENRQAYQQRVQDKMNKDMRRLLQYYGIINLVNPDAAPNMLKLGTAMLQQDIEAMGSARQAKIFDAVFGDKPPTTAMDAYQRVMKAGGTVEDAEAISGMVEKAMPATSSRAPTTAEVKLQIMAELKSLISQGREEEAKQLYMDAVYNNIIDTPTGENALAMSPEAAAQAYINAMRSSGVAAGNEGLYNLVKID